MNLYKKRIGEKIKYFRGLQRMTQSELAVKLGVEQSTVGRWETGHFSPQPGHLHALADVFGITEWDLVDTSVVGASEPEGMEPDLISRLELLEKRIEEVEALKEEDVSHISANGRLYSKDQVWDRLLSLEAEELESVLSVLFFDDNTESTLESESKARVSKTK